MPETVLDFTEGAKFIFTLRKSLVDQPLRRWVNRYEAVAVGAGGLVDLQGLGDDLVGFEQQVHYEKVHFDQWEVATWTPDSIPYNPETFYTSAQDLVGVRDDAGSDYLDISVVNMVRRQAVSGRNGMIALRGALIEDDVVAQGGKWAWDPTAKADFVNALGTGVTHITNYLGNGNGVLALCMITKDDSFLRHITGLVVGKITTIPDNHRYFRHSQPALPMDGQPQLSKRAAAIAAARALRLK